MNKRIGLHLRFEKSIVEVFEQAATLELPFFQCFLVDNKKAAIVSITQKEIEKVEKIRSNFSAIFIHSSYFINVAELGVFGRSLLLKELHGAHILKASHFVLHLGSMAKETGYEMGIKKIAQAVKFILQETDMFILIENTAHKNACGSDILDVVDIFEELSWREKLFFCLDTAHAYSFGYDFISENEQNLFLDFLGNSIGFEKIALIHLNDSLAKKKSYIDSHAAPGNGLIGLEPLKKLMTHQKLQNTPVLCELTPREINDALLILKFL